eukprot:TRINITY_DN21028_c0_g1_i1.p2 TRINITY_DN21028_c0_g1~~TRINITY_DN21028_c0_g1_i1.p2  ORF type:complete len:190 (-),score=36.69 TRINITY_DN21028_c0_g1_i1:403-972(-)
MAGLSLGAVQVSGTAVASWRPSSISCGASDFSAAKRIASSSAPASALPPLVLSHSSQTPEANVVDPSFAFANLMWFKGAYNAQVFVSETESAESVVRRFRRAYMQAGVVQECKRRQYFETPQDIKKRKQENARRQRRTIRQNDQFRRSKAEANMPRGDNVPMGGEGEEREEKSKNKNEEEDDYWGPIDD